MDYNIKIKYPIIAKIQFKLRGINEIDITNLFKHQIRKEYSRIETDIYISSFFRLGEWYFAGLTFKKINKKGEETIICHKIEMVSLVEVESLTIEEIKN
jgi:hypothetical protein